MVSEEAKSVISRAKEIYEQRLKSQLETTDRDRFVAIEPDSGDYFIADTFDEAVRLARTTHSTKLTHTIRIGHIAAFHLGVLAL
jgi:hypothetical protein